MENSTYASSNVKHYNEETPHFKNIALLNIWSHWDISHFQGERLFPVVDKFSATPVLDTAKLAFVKAFSVTG